MDTKMIYWYIIDKTIRETKKDKEMESKRFILGCC